MVDRFNSLPVWAQGVFLIVAFVAMATSGLLVSRPWVRSRVGTDPEHNERVIFIVEAVGVFYALLPGLVAFGAYDHFNRVKELANRESALLGTFYREAQALSNERRCELQSLVDDYMHHQVNKVWPEQSKGVIVQAGGRTDAIQKALMGYEPVGAAQTAAQAVMFERWGDFSDARRERQMQVEIGVQPVLYFVLFLGGLVVVGLTWLLSVERRSDHIALSAIVAAFIALFLFLIVVLDYPLKRSNAIGPNAWEVALQNVIIEPVDGTIPGCPNSIDEYVRAGGVRTPSR
jgi:hypothetical protein